MQSVRAQPGEGRGRCAWWRASDLECIRPGCRLRLGRGAPEALLRRGRRRGRLEEVRAGIPGWRRDGLPARCRRTRQDPGTATAGDVNTPNFTLAELLICACADVWRSE